MTDRGEPSQPCRSRIIFQIRETLKSVGSTSDYLKSYLELGEPRSVLARAQTAGKGRSGRRWHSPPGQGVYASYLFYPDLLQREAGHLNRAGALAVVRTICRFEPGVQERIRIKEPNDVLVGHRKISGVLVELGSLGKRVRWVIIGIGVNLSQTDFPVTDTRFPPTSLVLETGRQPPSRLQFYQCLTRNLTRLLQQLQEGAFESPEAQWRRLRGDALLERR